MATRKPKKKPKPKPRKKGAPKSGPPKRLRSRPGYQHIAGTKGKYIRLSDGEHINYRQYIRETEGVTLERKVELKRSEREKYGLSLNRGQLRLNAIVAQYKLVNGPNAKVRGNSPEAIAFREHYRQFIKSTRKDRFRSRREWIEARLAHLDAGVELGIMTSEERDQYMGEE